MIASPEVPLPKAGVRVAAPVAVALALRTNVVPLVMEATTAPAGMPVPVTAMPGTKPFVLPTVTVALALVVAALASARFDVRFAFAERPLAAAVAAALMKKLVVPL